MRVHAGYVGRFAPSPTGALHAGSLVAALASWLDARAHNGHWLVRIEDVDTPRCVPGAAEHMLAQLATCGLVADETPVWQSKRAALYEAALVRLTDAGWVYPCACTRSDIERALRETGSERPRHHELVYPGTCRSGLHGKPARAMRLLVAASTSRPSEPLSIVWHDRRLGALQQDVTHDVGDFVLKRADGLWAYQLAVVVDDAAQGVTHVVRGEDLADTTPRQMHLQQCLGCTTPVYLHTPLVLGSNGEKLSKQNGAQPLSLENPRQALRAAAAVLGLHVEGTNPADWLAAAVKAWRAQWPA
jgi:glutamyl-Q tRNA(Asp) synthetase